MSRPYLFGSSPCHPGAAFLLDDLRSAGIEPSLRMDDRGRTILDLDPPAPGDLAWYAETLAEELIDLLIGETLDEMVL